MKTETVTHHNKNRDSVYWQTVFQGIIAVFTCLLLLGGVCWSSVALYDRQFYVSVRWEGDVAVLSLSMDSPNRVTCLAYYSPEGEAIAEFPQPIYLISSGGKTLTKSQMKQLIWRIDRTGKETVAPAPGTPIWAMYDRMNWSAERMNWLAERGNKRAN